MNLVCSLLQLCLLHLVLHLIDLIVRDGLLPLKFYSIKHCIHCPFVYFMTKECMNAVIF